MMEMKKYKLAALAGIIIMGIGAFLACLASTGAAVTIGNIMLVVSLVILIYAFSHWQP